MLPGDSGHYPLTGKPLVTPALPQLAEASVKLPGSNPCRRTTRAVLLPPQGLPLDEVAE